MYVALAQAGGADPEELGLLVKLANGSAPTITHAGAQAADQLVNQIGQHAFVGHPAFDALGHQLSTAGGFLRVAVRRALRHSAHGPHSAITLESAALI